MKSTEALVDHALATASHEMQSKVHRMEMSPGALVFHQDMLMDVPFVADLLLLREKRQALIDYNVCCENNQRQNHDWRPREYGKRTCVVSFHAFLIGGTNS
jgi:hypothetical protein